MKHLYQLLFAACLLCNISGSTAQVSYFPPVSGGTWDTVSLAELGWCRDKVDTLLQYLGNKNTKAFIVLVDGKIAVEKYFGAFTADSIWYWASAGKTITSMATGIAQQEGYLSISDTTSDYLGNGWTVCTPTQEKKITVRHQLTMTSGLDDGVPDHYCTIDTCLQYKADAGTRWAYHNGPYTLLDSVMEAATGMSLNAWVYNKISRTVGMTGLFLQQGFNNVYFSNARSMARFGLLVLNKGSWNGTPVISDTSYFRDMVNTSQSLNQSYGYLWWLNGKATYMIPQTQIVFTGPLNPSAPSDMFAGLGKNGQLLNVVPSKKLVMVRMGEVPSAGEVPFTLNDTVWQYLNRVVCATTTSVGAIARPNTIEVYPVPATSSFTIELPAACDRLVITDMAGRMQYASVSGSEKYVIQCDQWPAGIYFAEVISPDLGRIKKKIVVVH